MEGRGKIGDGEKIPTSELENCILNEVFHGCKVARDLQTRMNSASPSSDPRELIAQSSSEIVTTFRKVMQLLGSSSSSSSPRLVEKPQQSIGEEEMLHLPDPISIGGSLKQSSSSKESAAVHGHLAAALPMIKSSETAESSERESSSSIRDRIETSKQKKSLPKWTMKVDAISTEAGHDVPPDDGHTWRKYGQKDILGSQHPRSYYRCTHKYDMGCQAKKRVQRYDDSPRFEITYIGFHVCQIKPRLLELQNSYRNPEISPIAHRVPDNAFVFGSARNTQPENSTFPDLSFAQIISRATRPLEDNDLITTMVSYQPPELFPIYPHHANPIMVSCRPPSLLQPKDEIVFTHFLPPEPQELELGIGSFSQSFCSADSGQSDLMHFMDSEETGNTGHEQSQRKASEAEVVSVPTCRTDSPLIDMDIMFHTDIPELQLGDKHLPWDPEKP